MTKDQIFKGAIIVVVICLFLYRQYSRKKAKNKISFLSELETPTVFFSINEGNQTELIYAPEVKKEWFEELKNKYSWDNFDDYDNIFWEYMYQLFDTLPDIADKAENDTAFFNNLNRAQKVFYSLLVFNGDTDNGGVTQFFFNKPEFAFAVLETFEALKMTKLKNDYEKCLNEFIGTNNSYAKRKEIFNNSNLNWENRWKAFTDGYDDIQSANAIEEYYYNSEFRKELYKKFVDYADKNINQFVRQ